VNTIQPAIKRKVPHLYTIWNGYPFRFWSYLADNAGLVLTFEGSPELVRMFGEEFDKHDRMRPDLVRGLDAFRIHGSEATESTVSKYTTLAAVHAPYRAHLVLLLGQKACCELLREMRESMVPGQVFTSSTIDYGLS